MSGWKRLSAVLKGIVYFLLFADARMVESIDKDVLGKIPSFVSTVCDLLNVAYGIDVDDYYGATLPCDHVCWRTASLEEYRHMKRLFVDYGAKLLAESMIGGRPISSFKLQNPIHCGPRKVSVVELPCPKESRAYDSGFEHCEFVVSSGNNIGTCKMKALVKFQSNFPSVEFEVNEKDINSDFALQLTEGVSCKFHSNALEEIIDFEKRHNMLELVPESYFASRI